MINAAIVGLGWWGRYIVGSLQGKSDSIRFIRAVDTDPDAASSFADENGLRFSSDFGDALNDDTVDAVILATPHSWHEEQIVQAAAAGKHVFSEKPLALKKASAMRAVAACEHAGVILGIGHERRFEPALIEIKTLVNSGVLGTIMHVEANFSHDGLAAVKAGEGDDVEALFLRPPSGADDVFRIAGRRDGYQHVAVFGQGPELIDENIVKGDIVGDGGDHLHIGAE